MTMTKLAPLFHIDPGSDIGLQDQLRKRLTEAAVNGAFPPDSRFPSSRALARRLGVARNTVVLAYQKMLDEGLLISRERSGIYVNPALLKGRVVGVSGESGGRDDRQLSEWKTRFRHHVDDSERRGARRVPHWRQYPYPFIDGLFDESLFPVQEWRESMRQALSVSEINTWSVDFANADDPRLIEEIRTKILPRRGIKARPDEILITMGSQQALSLITELLVDAQVHVAVEEPGFPDFRHLVERRGGQPVYQPVDEQGLVIDDGLDDCQLVYVTPSHQYPTGATLSLERRKALIAKAQARNQVIIEDDYACETNYLEDTLPALYSLDDTRRVIYVAGLSKVLSPGLRLGFMVAPPEVIAEARILRRLLIRHPPMNLQRAAAYFLAMGHYDATMIRVGRLFQARRIALREALNHYLPNLVSIAPLLGGTAYWVKGPPNLNIEELIELAERNGVLIESAAPYYRPGTEACHEFLVGATSLSIERIRQGVAVLRDCIRQLLGDGTAPTAPGDILRGDDVIRKAMSGCVMLYKTVYGDPCTMEFMPDGTIVGRSGYANEDCDNGHWWIEDGKWCRRWQGWAYGEVGRFNVCIHNGRVSYLNDDGATLFSAIYVSPEQASRAHNA